MLYEKFKNLHTNLIAMTDTKLYSMILASNNNTTFLLSLSIQVILLPRVDTHQVPGNMIMIFWIFNLVELESHFEYRFIYILVAQSSKAFYCAKVDLFIFC